MIKRKLNEANRVDQSAHILLPQKSGILHAILLPISFLYKDPYNSHFSHSLFHRIFLTMAIYYVLLVICLNFLFIQAGRYLYFLSYLYFKFSCNFFPDNELGHTTSVQPYALPQKPISSSIKSVTSGKYFVVVDHL